MKRTLYLFLLCCCSLLATQAYAQLPPGSDAPNFTVTDLDGNVHELQDYLDDGKTVVIDFFATWCAPCWNYHQTHALEDLHTDYGNDFVVLAIEVDAATNTACMYGPTGCNNNTQGDWTLGVTYPQASPDAAQAQALNNAYAISAYPTIMTICPDGKIFESGQATTAMHATWKQSCDFAAEVIDIGAVDCYEDEDGYIDINTIEGFGNISYQWSDGSTGQDPMNLFPGTYDCTLKDGNNREVVLENIVVNGPSSELIVGMTQQQDVTCNGDADGLVEISVDGGSPNYSFNWSNGSSGQNITNVSGGDYTVVVTDDNNCFKNLSASVYEPNVMVSTIQTDDESCENNNGTITIESVGGNGGYLYNNGFNSNTTGVFNNLYASTYDMTSTDDKGCNTIDQATIVNIPAPVAFAGDDVFISCDDIQLQGDGPSGANITYTWVTNDGNIVSGGNTLQPTIDQAGSYSLLILDLNTGCSDIDDVFILADPDVPQAVVANTNGLLNCNNPMLTIDGSGSTAGNTISYEWITTDGNIVDGATTTNPTIDQAGTYTLIVTSSTSTCVSETTVIVTEDLSVPSVETSGDALLNCLNSETDLVATVSSINESSILWELPNGTEIVDQNTITATEGGLYTVTVTDLISGCTTVEEVTIEENMNTPTADAGTAEDITCELSEVTLQGSGSTGDDISYAWTTTDGAILSGENTLNPIVGSGGTYMLVVTDLVSGCTSTSSVEIEGSDDLPVIAIEEPAAIDCDNLSIDIDGTGSEDGGDISYEWVTTDGSIIAGQSTDVATVDQAGTYTLLVLNTLTNCQSALSVVVGDDRDIPDAAFDSGIQGLTVDLDNLTIGDYDIAFWSFGNGVIRKGDQTSYTYDKAGTYNLCLTIVTDCGETVICKTIVVTDNSVREEIANDDILTTTPILQTPNTSLTQNGSSRSNVIEHYEGLITYPNPSSDKLYLEWAGDGEFEIKLFDMTGRQLYQTKVESTSTTIDLLNRESGVYIVTLKQNDQVITKKIIVEK